VLAQETARTDYTEKMWSGRNLITGAFITLLAAARSVMKAPVMRFRPLHIFSV
jgi:hypothetical protein